MPLLPLMMRFFIECSYDGTPFQGWQKQPGRRTVQDTLEKALQILLKNPTTVLVGCGRTDTGVHARKYIAHFDDEAVIGADLIYHWNAILPQEVAVHKIVEVPETAHARYDAISRTYDFHLHGLKSPFLINKSFFYNRFDQLNPVQLQLAAQLLLEYSSFYPFCLSKSGVNNYNVEIERAEWRSIGDHEMIFSITANRFLRGMVRLITGMCIHVAIGQLNISTVKECLDSQIILTKSWSVPPHGLYLVDVKYPYAF